jgi:hypothetical protein
MTMPNGGTPPLLSIAILRDADHRAITAENPTGERGGGGRATDGTGAAAARDLGVGWKVSPSVMIQPGQTFDMADIAGEGVIEHIWMATRPEGWRSLLLRVRWDDEAGEPAISVPLGDFFCQGWAQYSPLMSELVVVAPHAALNCYFPMPFRTGAHFSIENIGAASTGFYYQIDYALTAVPADAAYLHATWRRSSPVAAGDVHTIVDGVSGRGKYLGTYLAVGVNGPGWWGEGEVKFFLDDDTDYPTICGTGTEDYFGGAWDFDVPGHGYTAFSAPYLGLHQVLLPDGLYKAQTRFGMYRWHVPDPIDFRRGLKATIQDLGWRPDGRYWPRSDDIASVAYWYSDVATGVAGDPLTVDRLQVGSRP